MVNRVARTRFAELLRHFAAGVITNHEYEARRDAIFAEEDAIDDALSAISDQVWFLYDDFRTHRLRGPWALTRANRRDVARCVLFLYSDHEYGWPTELGLTGCFLSIITLGLWARRVERRLEAVGDLALWPFTSKTELASACRELRLLGSKEG